MTTSRQAASLSATFRTETPDLNDAILAKAVESEPIGAGLFGKPRRDVEEVLGTTRYSSGRPTAASPFPRTRLESRYYLLA